jgi:hypothetical protein
MDTQIYSLLSDGEIRLLRVLPGEWDTTLVCELFTIRLLSATGQAEAVPSYTALSYAWGYPIFSQKIFVNGTEFKITRNLENALRRCRLHDQDLTLWVDQICINQKTVDERSHQVKFMRAIFGYATEVIAYVGEPPNVPRKKFRRGPEQGHVYHFDYNSKNSNYEARDETIFHRPKTEIIIFNVMNTIRGKGHIGDWDLLNGEGTFGNSLDATAIYEAVRMFTQSPWWKRIWIVQEVVIPLRITMRYGCVSCPWGMLQEIAMAWDRHARGCCLHSAGIPNEYSKVLDHMSKVVLGLEQVRQVYLNQLKLITHSNELPADSYFRFLLDFLRQFRDRKASDERDKIYALLSLLPGELRILPNYSMSPEETFTFATVKIINATRSLSCLKDTTAEKLRGDLPSWVPDWSVQRSDVVESHLYGLYNAAPGSCWVEHVVPRYIGKQHSLKQRNGFLKVEGIILGQINTIEPAGKYTSVQRRVDEFTEIYARLKGGQHSSKVEPLRVMMSDSFWSDDDHRVRISKGDEILLVTWAWKRRLEKKNGNLSVLTSEDHLLLQSGTRPLEHWIPSEATTAAELWDHILLLIQYLARFSNINANGMNEKMDQISQHRVSWGDWGDWGVWKYLTPHQILHGLMTFHLENRFQSAPCEPGFYGNFYNFLFDTYGTLGQLSDALYTPETPKLQDHVELVERSIPSAESTAPTVFFAIDTPNTVPHIEPQVLGLAPPSAKLSNMVALVGGADLPLVLESDDEGHSYRIVGECYLHGYMDGKAVPPAGVGWSKILLV